jgi:sugar lactone lactonase YvrE
MRQSLRTTGLLLGLAILYLLFWPVPINPVTWDAPQSAGYVDPFETNNRLRFARAIELGDYVGPEDVAIGSDGYLYVPTLDGTILRIHPREHTISVFANTGGRPLGIEADADGSFLVANSYLGLQRVMPDGAVSLLLDEVAGKPLVYPNNLALADNGVVYLSECSTRFSPHEYGGTLQASILDLMEHNTQARIIRYDPVSGDADVLLDGLSYANGIAISTDQSYLLINETGNYRVLRYWLEGPAAGTSDVILDNLPGFPDNLTRGHNDRFWIGLIAPRNELLDKLSDKPFLRKVTQRLPAFLRPKATMSSHVFAITGDGVVLMDLQEAQPRFPMLTGVTETEDALYLTTLIGSQLPVLAKRDL